MADHAPPYARPPAPADEDERLAALDGLHLLDTPPEQEFDEVTRRLAEIFEAPISLMSLVDRDRQWWKSQRGLPADLAAAGQTPRDVAVCDHVVGGDQTLVVEDLHQDPRFVGNPLVERLGLRFYAGAPLRTDDGHAVGSLCVIDTKPRAMSDRERRLLEMVADGAMREVRLRGLSQQLRDLNRQAARHRRAAEDDMDRARSVQAFLLPACPLESASWRVSHLYRPAAHVGGDYVDRTERPDGSVVVLVADVLGHGVSAALMAAILRSAFLRHAASSPSPHALLSAVQRDLAALGSGSQFVTALAAVLHPSGRRAAVAAAGHPYPVLLRGGAATLVEVAGDLPLLVSPEDGYHTSTEVELEPGDRLLLYTDGAYEVPADGAGDGRLLGVAGLIRVARALRVTRGTGMLEELFGRLSTLAGGRMPDDVALVCIEPR